MKSISPTVKVWQAIVLAQFGGSSSQSHQGPRRFPAHFFISPSGGLELMVPDVSIYMADGKRIKEKEQRSMPTMS